MVSPGRAPSVHVTPRSVQVRRPPAPPGGTMAGVSVDQPTDRTSAAEAVDETVEFNPFLPEIREDPYPLYHRMRREDPVHWNVPGIWILTRHADAVRML